MRFRHLATALTVGIGTVATLILLGLLGNMSAAATHEPILSLSSTVQKPAASSIRYVAISGIDSGDCDTPSGACRTIQYAVDHDMDGAPRLMGHGSDFGGGELRIALTVTKQAAPDPVQAGAPLTYTIRVTNTGNVTLNATVTDILPHWVTPTGALTWRDVTLAPGGVWSEQAVVEPRLCYSGTLSNRVQVRTLEGATGVYTETSAAVSSRHCVYLPIVSKAFPPLIQVPEGAYQFVEYWTFSVLGDGCQRLCIDFPTYSFDPDTGKLTIYSVFHPSPTLTLDDDDVGYFGRGTILGGVGCGASSDPIKVEAYPFSTSGITLHYVDLTGTLTLQREDEPITLDVDEAWTSDDEIEVWDWLGVGCVVTNTHRITNYGFEDRDKIIYWP